MLLDLPNELIINILSDETLSLTDIYIVSCLSKRLNILALPIYLADHGITEPEREISLDVLNWDPYINVQPTNTTLSSGLNLVSHTLDALSGLNISTNISRVKHFKCCFQDPTTRDCQRNSFQPAHNLPLAVERTARFIQKLNYVRVAEIYLVWDPYYVQRNKTITHVPVAELNEWTESFCRFLNLIVERGCTSLTVQYDAAIEPAFRFRSSNPITKTFSNVFQYVQKRQDKEAPTLHWDLERPIHEGKLDPSSVATAPLSLLAQESKSVVSLSLHSNALLLPPFVNWTLSLLYTHSSLTCITFAHLTFPKQVWTTLLPLIADAVSHRLTNLSFFLKCTNLTAEDLIRFLARLPHLTHLLVGQSIWSRFQVSDKKLQQLTPPYLLHLRVLQAPPELVSLLLKAQQLLSSSSSKHEAATSFPKLRSLIVYPCRQLDSAHSYSESTSFVNTLINQIQNQSRGHEVTYAFDLQTDFSNPAHSIPYLQSQASEQKVYPSLWDEVNGVEVEESKKSRRHGSPIVFFDITRVILYPHHPPTPSLYLWLKLLFPNLKTLVFTCRITAQPEQVSMLDETMVEQLIKELPVTCPTVHTLVVADKTYKLSGDSNVR